MKPLLAACLLWLCLPLAARAAQLRIDTGHGAQDWSSAQLLARADAREVAIPADVAYGRAMRYRALPLLALLPQLVPGEHLQFVARDGFVAEMPADVLLNRQGAQAWLAVEDPARHWPALAGKAASAGPFYLVWTKPQAARIGPEQWPYQLASIRVLAGADARFPAIVPHADADADAAVRRGFDVFKRTCFACHTMNGEGDAQLGPDLNLPYNPTEYLRADLLRGFIRNPQSLRRWPQAKMQGFPTQDSLGDADLDAVLAYLRYMAKHKVAH
jgi:mono/diheme cytochrome c family protein